MHFSLLLRIKNQIGKGQFGAVSIGMWKRKKGPHIEVAIKTLSEESSPDDKVKFLQEAAIMAQFRHPNVVQLYGIVSEGLEVRYVVFFLIFSYKALQTPGHVGNRIGPEGRPAKPPQFIEI